MCSAVLSTHGAYMGFPTVLDIGFPIVFAKGFGAHGCEVQGSDTKGLSFKSLGVYPKP